MVSGTVAPWTGEQRQRRLIDPAGLAQLYSHVRSFSRYLCEPLRTEDYVVQSMPDVSPTKWHLAHTTWFFETFVLRKRTSYEVFDPAYESLFNSYYNSVGCPFPRAQRGLLSRPSVQEVMDYRLYVDTAMLHWIHAADSERDANALYVALLGLHHEQQHQELMLTDIKHVFSINPLDPVYRPKAPVEAAPEPFAWHAFDEDIVWIGDEGEGFSYDNEQPRHRAIVHAFELGSRLVTAAEYLEFMDDGGYLRPELWLSDGWTYCQEHALTSPAYWRHRDGQWLQFTLSGVTPVHEDEPVCHVSYFEADAYARWAGARLPSECEWELASRDTPIQGNFVETEQYHPLPDLFGGSGIHQMFGDVWEWTQSPYVAYPGYAPAAGALGEYNGKFMCNQFVLRGGSCATAISHIRHTYRNFFVPDARWQFSGIRLARNA